MSNTERVKYWTYRILNFFLPPWEEGDTDLQKTEFALERLRSAKAKRGKDDSGAC